MNKPDKLSAPSQLSRRAFLKFTGTGAAVTLLAACAAPQAGNGGQAQSAPAASDSKISLSFWTPGGSKIYCEGFATIAKNYTELNPNVQIEPAQCGTGEQNFNEVLLARVAAGNPPDSTIIWTSPAAFGARSALIEMDELMAASKYSQKDSWPTGVLASCLFKGKTYGLPVAAGTYAMFYNGDMLASQGITKREDFPKTWDDMRKLSKEFTKWNGDKLETIGLLPWRDQYTLPIWSALNGSQLYDAANQKYQLDNDANVAMMDYGLKWLNEDYEGDITKTTKSANWDGYPDSEGRSAAFNDGKMAMYMNGFWFTGDMYNFDVKNEHWDVASLPVGPGGQKSVSGYWPNWLAVPKGSRHPEEAFKYLDYMSGEGIKVWFANVPDLPANKNVPTDLVPKTVVDKRGQEFAQNVTDFFHSQLDVATPMWDSPVQDFATDQIGRALENIYAKKATPK
ncbi:MAG: substrate-binding domain-containing protein, partial [Chloroflexi bacterium]|nr:substrate-binding domain-containing protein [Chloroflexota bacterium]